MNQILKYRPEFITAAGNTAVNQPVNNPPYSLFTTIDRLRVAMALLADINNRVGFQAENKDVVIADNFPDFNISTVQRADGNGAVHHELHIAGARRLLAGSGNLLTYVSSRDNQFGQGDAVVLDENKLDLILDGRIVIVSSPPEH